MTQDDLVFRELAEQYNDVMTTKEAVAKYQFISFLAPFAIVKDLETGVKGTLQFTHMPRFYFNFVEDK